MRGKAAQNEITGLRAAAKHCHAHHSRAPVDGVKRAGRKSSGLTTADQRRLAYQARKFRAAWDRYRAETETTNRLPLADWLTVEFAKLPADVQAIRSPYRWLRLAERW